ncbi:hypothetical protein ACFLZV_06760 [Candidatus Margulisiibacteriota bacterium]
MNNEIISFETIPQDDCGYKRINKIYDFFSKQSHHYKKSKCHENIKTFLEICRKNKFFSSSTVPEKRVSVIYSHNAGNGIIHYVNKSFG